MEIEECRLSESNKYRGKEIEIEMEMEMEIKMEMEMVKSHRLCQMDAMDTCHHNKFVRLLTRVIALTVLYYCRIVLRDRRNVCVIYLQPNHRVEAPQRELAIGQCIV